MNLLAAFVVVAAFGIAAALVLPSVRRTRLGVWHPAVAWLLLDGVFFGVGSAALAIDGRTGPALYVAACTLALALGVAASDRVARRRVDAAPAASESPTGDPAPVEPAPGDATRLVAAGRARSASRPSACSSSCRPSRVSACRPSRETSQAPGAS